jgi:hypothetical protein
VTTTAVVALVAAGASVALALILARVVLGGILAMMFRRVRSFVRRAMDRRRAPRPGHVDRRRSERRNG